MTGVNRLGLLGVGELCAQIAARSDEMFRRTGRAVAATPPGPLQRFWATASHRHAWHADLAGERSPTVIVIDHVARVERISRELFGRDRVEPAEVNPDRLGSWWNAQRSGLSTVLEAARTAVDGELDPGTARILDLVGSDLDALGRWHHSL